MTRPTASELRELIMRQSNAIVQAVELLNAIPEGDSPEHQAAAQARELLNAALEAAIEVALRDEASVMSTH